MINPLNGGAGNHTIMPATDLPSIVKPNTMVDGYTQPGTSVNTDPYITNAVQLIEIKGQFNDPNFDGITIGKGISLSDFEIVV